MSGTAKQSDTEQQTPTGLPNASPVTHVSTLGISIAAILQAGGTWPPVGTTQRTESVTQPRSALPAICTTKDGNGITVKDLTALSPEELRTLCSKHSRRESMGWKSLDNCANITDKRLSNTLHEHLRSLSDQQKEVKIQELRDVRSKLLFSVIDNNAERKSVNSQLYMLTGCVAYKWR